MYTKRLGNNGFLMMEVAIAVVILATGVLIALKAISSATAAEKELKDRTRASLLLKEKAEEVFARAGNEKMEGLPAAGNFGERAEDFEWTAEQVADQDGEKNWLRVQVLWPADGKNKNSVETRMLLSSAPSEGSVPVE